MTSTAFEVCTPEEEEFFREKQAHDDEQARRIKREQQAEDDVVCELMLEAELMRVQAQRAYAAIRDGRIPGVVLGGGHE